jgi:hypothetical protein
LGLATTAFCQDFSKFPNTEQGAKDLLQEFAKPGADIKSLSAKLQPSTKDYESVFLPELAKRMIEEYTPAWKEGLIKIAPKPEQTEVQVFSATSAEIKGWTGNAKKHFAGGYEQLGPWLKDDLVIYRFRYVKPGESLGMAYDGLAHVNGQWRYFPKAYRLVK